MLLLSYILRVSHDSICEANTSKGGRTASDRQEHKGGSNFSPFVTFVFPYWLGISLAGKTFCDLCEKFFLRAE